MVKLPLSKKIHELKDKASDGKGGQPAKPAPDPKKAVRDKEYLDRLNRIKQKLHQARNADSPLRAKEQELLDTMRKAIEDGYLSPEERARIMKLLEEFYTLVMVDNTVDAEETMAIEKITTTLRTIIQVHDKEHPDDKITDV